MRLVSVNIGYTSVRLVKHQLISVYFYVRGTNTLHSNKSLKNINRYINHDLSLIVQWLWANRICLNQAKTEIIIFWPKGKIITKHLNFRISGQKINPINQTKYLGIYLDKHLSWNSHLNQLKSKLSRGCRVFSTGGGWGGVPPPLAKNLLIPLPPGKIPPPVEVK